MKLAQLNTAACLGAKLQALTSMRSQANRNSHGIHLENLRGVPGDNRITIEADEAKLVLDALINNIKEQLILMGVEL